MNELEFQTLNEFFKNNGIVDAEEGSEIYTKLRGMANQVNPLVKDGNFGAPVREGENWKGVYRFALNQTGKEILFREKVTRSKLLRLFDSIEAVSGIPLLGFVERAYYEKFSQG